ncbi:hypothetical protein ACRALDRAFT_2025794 [Sodiomyces alcalophilus JCM 7366]|uniref:uncharacterized protein n=1 Tax=Sodiomyces alcalophilus JCM 7366 TaxID=591952 RepID=UPI0039B3C905
MVELLPSALSHHGINSNHQDSPITDVSRVAAATVAARVLLGASVASRPENKMMTREEHAAMMRELNKKRAGWRTPRRGWSSTDSPVVGTTQPSNPSVAVPSPLAHVNQYPEPVERSHRLIPDRSPPVRQPPPQKPAEPEPSAHTGRPSRPKPPPPRRSYSVMDYEPASPTHRPSPRMAITDLPAEIHFAVFDFLDPIDSTCFGLTSKHFYAIHRRMHGSVPLSSRREGPNDLEWAWRGAGPLVHSKAGASPTAGVHDEATRERLRVKGQVYCRKCGISRCELHRHLREWMLSAGKRYEYCAVTTKYGPPAPEDAKEFCHLRSPKRPHRCGRHSARNTGALTPQEQRSKA